MRIIDVSIFLAEHEQELLFLKLNLEQECVSEWVIAENYYTYRGNYKGPKLENLLKQERFKPFIDRIKIISNSENFSCPAGTYGDNIIDPRDFHNSEARLRNSPTQYILDKYSDEDRVIISDIDEVVDFSDSWRRDRLLKAMKVYERIQFDRIRYTWDFNNFSPREKRDLITPCFSIKAIKAGSAQLSDKKWIGEYVDIEDNKPLIFEYSFCFDRPGIDYKYSTSLHTCWTKDNIDISINCNHWTMTTYQKIDFRNRWHWFEKVELNENNSPKYVRDNLEKLKTNLVPENYKENRLKEYRFCANF